VSLAEHVSREVREDRLAFVENEQVERRSTLVLHEEPRQAVALANDMGEELPVSERLDKAIGWLM
jgi:hypothetical protein